MGKTRQLVAALRRKDFLLKAGSIFAAVIGFASAALELAGWHLQLIYVVCFVTAALLAAAYIAHRQLVTPQISVGTVLEGDIDKRPSVRVRCPCSINQSVLAKKLAQTCFAGQSTISPDIYEQLRVKNPLILACLIDRGENLLGYFDVIPLRETFAHAFLRGLVGEDQMTHEDVVPPSVMHQCKYLYLSGLAVQDANKPTGHRNANILIWAFLKYLEHFYNTTNAFAFAIAVTQDGDELLQKFKLQLAADAEVRTDKHNLYSIHLTPNEIERRLNCLPDWSNICSLDWSPPPTRSSLTQSGRYVPSPVTSNVRNLTEARAMLRK